MRITDPQNNEKRYYRAATRVFQENGSWYFDSREGRHGPFSTPERADLAAEQYTAERNALMRFQAMREAKAENLRGPSLMRGPDRGRSGEYTLAGQRRRTLA